ncbi:hypothetical protein P9D84_06965 [Bacillus vallismortis]|uniref:hypothetical protein n=1 Tax=Bacillus vallismortis TaxID=72361 RepID=UPI002DB8A016|nr:hypothetical protein [Bacillus vallismortis]MCI4137629.1 hypothetical protein [Bacillus vallismortis]MEC1791140.1 hypothetical protein [Bacillus vallismortis]
MVKVDDKIGNVRLFKKHLRRLGLIGNRQQFSHEHIEMFESIKEYKIKNHTTWDFAFKRVLSSTEALKNNDIPLMSTIFEDAQNKNEEILLEILKTLKRIEAKL